MRLLAFALLGLAALVAAGLIVTWPATTSPEEISGIEPDLDRGAQVFAVAGCASCHAADEAEGEARRILTGGHRLVTPFGTFVAPNISQDVDHGIGAWTRAEVVSAIMHGTSPDGRHYYPAFPYAAYGKADLVDIVSLAAYLETLPADATPSEPHDLKFPANIRAGVGLWKLVNVTRDWVVSVPQDDPKLLRGRYLAEALGHCGECHTPRTLMQGLDVTRWFAGAPNPSGRGSIPNISPSRLDWSHDDIVAYLTTGFTPDFDVVGGTMTAVVAELKTLPAEDIDALAAYLKSVPASQ